MTKQKRFYVPPEWEEVLKKLEEIVKRENRTFSEWVREAANSYVRLHEPGNPQQLLTTIMEIGHAYRANSCCVCSKPAEVQVFTKKGLNLLY